MPEVAQNIVLKQLIQLFLLAPSNVFRIGVM